jgi:hypothetical protein
MSTGYNLTLRKIQGLFLAAVEQFCRGRSAGGGEVVDPTLIQRWQIAAQRIERYQLL